MEKTSWFLKIGSGGMVEIRYLKRTRPDKNSSPSLLKIHHLHENVCIFLLSPASSLREVSHAFWIRTQLRDRQ